MPTDKEKLEALKKERDRLESEHLQSIKKEIRKLTDKIHAEETAGKWQCFFCGAWNDATEKHGCPVCLSA